MLVYLSLPVFHFVFDFRCLLLSVIICFCLSPFYKYVAFFGLLEVVVTEEVVDDEVPEAFRFFAFEAG